MNAETFNRLVDTINDLYNTLDKLNRSGIDMLATQSKGLPYGDIHSAMKTCVGHLVAVAGEDFELHGQSLVSVFLELLYEDLGARGAFSELVEALAVRKDDALEELRRAEEDHVHVDECDELRVVHQHCFKVYKTLRDRLYTANAAV